MDFHKMYPLSKHNKIQIAVNLLFHHSNAIGQFVKKSWVALVGVVAPQCHAVECPLMKTTADTPIN